MVRAVTIDVQKVLLVAMPNTPNCGPLPYVEKEIADLDGLIPNTVVKPFLQTPKKADVIAGIREGQITHFACHGQSSYPDPSQSRLLLRDWKVDPLTVADLTTLNLKYSQLAYLSACYAADNRVFELLDEAIHLAGGCQLAGFPNVIGTLWKIHDIHSAKRCKGCLHQHVRRTGQGY